MYQNGGGDKIEKKLVNKLRERGIKSYTGINLRNSVVKKGHIYHNDLEVDKLELFFFLLRQG